MVKTFPSVRRRLIEISIDRIKQTAKATTDMSGGALRRDYVRQGLYQGQSLLVLDLDSCTRCDECTKACIQHMYQ